MNSNIEKLNPHFRDAANVWSLCLKNKLSEYSMSGWLLVNFLCIHPPLVSLSDNELSCMWHIEEGNIMSVETIINETNTQCSML